MFRSTLKFSILILGLTSLDAHAVQPMAETDLEGVSANTGNNILSIFGASEAGIEIDNESLPLAQEKHKESTEVLSEVNSDLLEDDQRADANTNETREPVIAGSAAEAIIGASENSVRTGATSGLTTSETRFKAGNFNHEATFLTDGSVQVNRDLLIDRLAIDNLAGDNIDRSRSAGSITISNWRSLGQTTISAE